MHAGQESVADNAYGANVRGLTVNMIHSADQFGDEENNAAQHDNLHELSVVENENQDAEKHVRRQIWQLLIENLTLSFVFPVGH